MPHRIIPVSVRDDYPYREVSNGVTLWRYLNGYKFEHLLETRSLWFSRIDQFNDQEEGLKPESSENSTGEQRFFDKYNISAWGEQYSGASSEQRTAKFGICWHMNSRENAVMWRRYTPECNDSIAIVATVKSLQRGLRNSGRALRCSPVQYRGPNDPRPQIDYDSIFFYKDKALYSFENEYRILTSILPSELPLVLDSDLSKRRIIPFNTNAGIRRIIFHPDATVNFKTQMRSKFRSVFTSVRTIEDSTL
jgi:hypothetical protein